MLYQTIRRTYPTVILCSLTVLSSTVPMAFAQAFPVPLINQPLVPDSAAPGGPAFTLTVNGTGFVTGATVNWNGSPRTTTLTSTSQLTAAISAADIATPSTASVTVINPGNTASVASYLPIAGTISPVLLSGADVSTATRQLNIAVGDFNGDGKLDFAANWAGPISLYLGKGDGTFQSPTTWPAGTTPIEPIVGDFNGDHNLDIAFIDGYNVTIVLGNGDGTFQAPIESPTGVTPNAGFAVGDFNGDGKLDLAIATGAMNVPGAVAILLGNGDGTFGASTSYAAGQVPAGIAIGDFNQDGHLDLAVTDGQDGGLSILLGNGDGTFQSQVESIYNDTYYNVVTADLNGDGKLDLAVICSTGVCVFLGDGKGNFSRPTSYGHPGIDDLHVADYNNDGKPDLVEVSSNVDAVILLGNGDGTFQSPTNYPVGNEDFSLGLGDFNGDGRLDFVTADYNRSVYSTFLQTVNPVVTLSAASLVFQPQAAGTRSATKALTLTNTGNESLNFTVAASPQFFIDGNYCGTTLAPGASCMYAVGFAPSGKGTRTGTIAFTDNAPGSPQVVSLSGTGTFVELTPASDVLDFENIAVGGSSAPQTITMKNLSDNQPINISSIALGGAKNFLYSDTTTCGASLAPLSSCTISVTFSPTSKGIKNARVTISDNGGASPQIVYLTGNGV